MQFLKSLFRAKPKPSVLAPRIDAPLVIEGYGLTLSPHLPAQVAHLEGGTLVLAYSPDENTLHNALVKPGTRPASEVPEARRWQGDESEGFWLLRNGPESSAIALGVGIENAADVFHAVAAGALTPWRLHAPDFGIDWPETFTLRTTLGTAPYAFELSLQGSDDMYLYLQGPFCGPEHIPTPDSLAAPGQTQAGQGTVPGALGVSVWVELGYEHEGEGWRQRYYYVVYDSDCVFLLKAQVRESMRKSMWEACERIVASFGPRH